MFVWLCIVVRLDFFVLILAFALVLRRSSSLSHHGCRYCYSRCVCSHAVHYIALCICILNGVNGASAVISVFYAVRVRVSILVIVAHGVVRVHACLNIVCFSFACFVVSYF